MLNGEMEAQGLLSKKLVNKVCRIESMRIRNGGRLGKGCVRVCKFACVCRGLLVALAYDSSEDSLLPVHPPGHQGHFLR